MLIPLADFPVRPRMEEGESLAGYICRFHGTNGHGMPRELHDAFRALYRGTPGKALAAFELVQNLLGNIVELDRSWWLGRPSLETRPNHYLQVWPTPKLNPARFCPACLREKGFHYALWELPLMESCPLHQCMLLTACPVCSEKLFWFNVQPGWRCCCGEPIMTMRHSRSKPRAQVVARALTGSCDVDLPTHFRRDFVTSKYGHYSFDEAYVALTWGAEFRRFFLKRRSSVYNQNSHGCQAGKRRLRPGLWEYRLVGDSTEKLISRLLRVLQKRFKGRQFLRFVYPSDSLIQAQEFMRKSAAGVVQTKIKKTLDRFLAGYVLELPTSLCIWCSEEANSELRNRYMRDFAMWWKDLSSRIGDLDPAMQLTDYNRSQYEVAHGVSPKEIQVVEVLNLLFDAALRRVDPGNFRELVYWWRIPPALRDVDNPDEVFRRIGLHLLSASNTEVTFVYAFLQQNLQGGDDERRATD